MYSIIIKDKENNEFEIICPVLIQEGSIVKQNDMEYVVEKWWKINDDSILNMNRVKNVIIEELKTVYWLTEVWDD